jgi:DNA-binding XRE family transcriptional regulator
MSATSPQFGFSPHPIHPAPVRTLVPGVTQRFGQKLRFLRKSKSMTQLQMAIYLGIDRSYISDLERGKKSVSLPTLEIIALGFHMSLSDLLDGI